MYTFFGRTDGEDLSVICLQISDKRRCPDAARILISSEILDRITRDKSIRVWTPNDFLDLGARSAIDKALQRLALSGDIRRIDRGLYDVPRVNSLTGKPSTPDYTAIIDAITRREALSRKKRQARLDAIKDTCREYIQNTLAQQFGEIVWADLAESNIEANVPTVVVDSDDPDGQSLLFWYPAVTAGRDDYIRPAVKIESGAKSALDPQEDLTIVPYISDEVPRLKLRAERVTTVVAERTFWDKLVILHGVRNWFENRGVLRARETARSRGSCARRGLRGSRPHVLQQP
jgi:hypothetical protein